MKKKHTEEKRDLELKNARLSALFAELDPNPLLRIDPEGKIIHYNDSAALLLKNKNSGLKDARFILDPLEVDLKSIIDQDISASFNYDIDGKHFTLDIRGVKFLNIAHIYFHDITERRVYEENLKLYQQKLRELSLDIQKKTEDERRRIANELHDSVGQQLSLLKLRVQQPPYCDGNAGPELLQSVDAITNEVRSILYQLKPKILDELGLGAAVKSLVDRINGESVCIGALSIIGEETRFKYETEINVFRIIQEAVHNIIKHAGANEYLIQIIYQSSKVRVIISDDGKGFDLEAVFSGKQSKSGFGLINMKERVESLNGFIKIDSNINEGTFILIDIPVEEVKEND